MTGSKAVSYTHLMLYRLTPTLIEKGYVYIAESPLFEIRCKDETYFSYSDAEKVEILQKLADKCGTKVLQIVFRDADMTHGVLQTWKDTDHR